jgi:hypothetical protein
VRWILDATITDRSNVNLTIAAPFITVTAPLTGASWGYGTKQRQSWTTNLGSGDTVEVRLSVDGGASYPTVLGSVKATSLTLYPTTPTLPSPVAAARIVVEWTKDRTVRGLNPGNFRIEPAFVIVTDPNGPATVWTVGTTKTVRWANNLGAYEYVDLLLSLDGGASFPVALASNTPSDGAQSIAVQSAWKTANARVKVVWRKDGQAADTSDQNFAIQ